jgi:hypothetical protein
MAKHEPAFKWSRFAAKPRKRGGKKGKGKKAGGKPKGNAWRQYVGKG